jgi:ssDNA-binding Zn-finger/Zn-ribbon topoisomerase 1
MNIIKACPRCGQLLVERTNRATGEPFLGCRRWPECTHSEPLPESVKLRRQGQRGMFDEELDDECSV